MNFEENRAGYWNVEAMLAASCVLAGGVDRGLFIEISFASQRKDSLGRVVSTFIGVNMNGERLGTALLTGPAFDARATGINGNAIDVADDTTHARFLTDRPCPGEG